MNNSYRQFPPEEEIGIRTWKFGILIAITVAGCAIAAPFILQPVLNNLFVEEKEGYVSTSDPDENYLLRNRGQVKFYYLAHS